MNADAIDNLGNILCREDKVYACYAEFDLVCSILLPAEALIAR